MGYLSRLATMAAPKSSRKNRVARLRFDSLEERAVPASYTIANTNQLTITLNTAGETITLDATGGGGIDVVGTVAATDGGGFVPTFGTITGNDATILNTVTSITIIDTANDGKVFFADSAANAYTGHVFNITLNNGIGTRVEFIAAGTSSFNSDFTATAQTITAGAGAIVNLSTTNTDFTVTSANAVALPTMTAGGGNVNVVSTAGSVTAAAITTASNRTVNLTAFGDITQTGPIVVPGGSGSANFAVTGNSAITLNDAGNNFGFLSLFSSHSSQTVSITEADDINISGATLGRAGLSLTATLGDIIQDDGIIQLPGAGAITLNAPEGPANAITLDFSSNILTGAITVANGPETVSLTNANSTASLSNLTLPTAGLTGLTLSHTDAPLVLGPVVPATVTSLTASGVGVYQSAPLTVTNAIFFSSNGPILLDKANDFTKLGLFASGAFDATVTDANGVQFDFFPSQIGSGRLTVTATAGDITQTATGSIQTGAGSVSSFKAGGQVDLSTATNFFQGRFEASVGAAGTLKLNNGTSLVLGNISTAAAANVTTITAAGSSITQAPGTKLNLVGPASFTSNSVTLNNPGNQFAGAVSLTTPSPSSLTATGNIDLGTSTVGTLTVTANNTTGTTAGNITQSGAITSGGTATFNGGLAAGSVTLTNAANNFNTVAGRVNGAGTMAFTDSNAIVLGSVILGTGTLGVTAGGAITQTGALRSVGATAGTVGAGVVTLTAPANISLNNASNEFSGSVVVAGPATGLTLRNRGDLDLDATDPVLATGAGVVVDVRAGKTIKLPNALLDIGSLTARANKILMPGNVTATGGNIAITGSATVGSTALTANSVTFGGTAGVTTTDVTAPLVVTTAGGNGLTVAGGTFNLGANSLTVATGTGGLTVNSGSRVTTSGTSAINLGAGNLSVNSGAVFQAGTNPTAAEVTTVTTTGGGGIILNGDLQAGLGAAGDRLNLAGVTGGVTLSSNSRLVGTGVAAAGQTVLGVTAGTGTIAGRFADSVDPISAASVPFKAGSDIVTADYAVNTAVTVSPVTASVGNTFVSTTGTVTGYLQNGQAYTVTAPAGSGLVVTEKLAANGTDLGLDIVLRTNTAASTLTITPTVAGTNGSGTVLLHSIAVNGAGAVTIKAPLADLVNGGITVQDNLKELTIRNVINSTIKSGGLATLGTLLTAKLVQGGAIDIGGVLTSLTAEDIDSSSSVVADKFVNVTTTGTTTGQGTAAGNLGARLTTRTAAAGLNLTKVTVAGKLSGIWDVFGNIGTIKARLTDGWNLGESITGANWGSVARNPDGLKDITTSLDIGRSVVSPVNIIATGNIKALLTTDWTSGGTFRAGSFGTITTKTDTVSGANGSLTSGAFLATGNVTNNAFGNITVVGEHSATLTAWNGNIGAVKVTKTLGGTINATTTPTLGSIASLTAGTVSGLTVDARRIGSITGVANPAAQHFGDIGSSSNSFTLRGNDGTAAKNAIGTVKTPRNLKGNTFNLLAGNLGSVTVGYQSQGNSFNLPDVSAGKVGSFTTGDSSSDSFTVASIGAITSKGIPQAPLSTLALLGNLSSFNVTAYGETGTVVGVGDVKAAGNLSSGSPAVIRSPNGVKSLTVGRLVSNYSIITDSPVAGTDVIGRVGSLTAGAISGLTLTGESVGAVTTKGFLTPESPNTTSRTAGLFSNSDLILKGAGVASGVAVGAVTTDSDIDSVDVNAPLGVVSVTAKGALLDLNVTADHLPLVAGGLTPVKAGYGKVGSITGFDYNSVDVRAATIGAVKSLADYLAADRGTITGSTFVGRLTTGDGIASITTAGNFENSEVNAPGGMSLLTVDELLDDSTVAAGYLSTAGFTGIKAGEVLDTNIVANHLGSFNVLGNLEPGSSLGGGVTDTFVSVSGANAGVGLGTFAALGTVAHSVFDISNGNLTSFTAARLRHSTIQVGARFTKGNALAAGVAFGGTDRTLGSLSLTAPALGATPTAEDLRDGSGFRDSYVTAAKINTVAITSAVATIDPTVEVQGIVFKDPAANLGSVTVNGVAVLEPTAADVLSKFDVVKI